MHHPCEICGQSLDREAGIGQSRAETFCLTGLCQLAVLTKASENRRGTPDDERRMKEMFLQGLDLAAELHDADHARTSEARDAILAAAGWPETANAWRSRAGKMLDQMWIPGSTVPGEFLPGGVLTGMTPLWPDHVHCAERRRMLPWTGSANWPAASAAL